MLEKWKPIIKTITSDNEKDPRALLEQAKQFARQQLIARALEIDYYFANAYCSWKRGANENLNGLVMQYFLKGSDFNLITPEQVKMVV